MKNIYFRTLIKVTEDYGTDPHLDPYQNITHPEHCLKNVINFPRDLHSTRWARGGQGETESPGGGKTRRRGHGQQRGEGGRKGKPGGRGGPGEGCQGQGGGLQGQDSAAGEGVWQAAGQDWRSAGQEAGGGKGEISHLSLIFMKRKAPTLIFSNTAFFLRKPENFERIYSSFWYTYRAKNMRKFCD